MRCKKHKSKPTKADHEEVDKTLQRHENELADMAARLRAVEIEVGIWRPPLKEANGV